MALTYKKKKMKYKEDVEKKRKDEVGVSFILKILVYHEYLDSSQKYVRLILA